MRELSVVFDGLVVFLLGCCFGWYLTATYWRSYIRTRLRNHGIPVPNHLERWP